MSSGPIRPDQIPHGRKVATDRFEVTVTVKKKGKWVRADLDNTETQALQGAIETIRQSGMQTKNWDAFNQEGEVLQLTSNEINVAQHGKWQNLLSDQTIDSEFRKNTQKTLETITSAFKRVKKGEVAILVKVVPFKELFAKRVEEEEAFYQHLLGLQQKLENKEVIQSLKDKGLSDGQILWISSRLDVLVERSRGVVEVMQQVASFIDQGKIKEGLKLYETQMPIRYAQFCDALQEWQHDQKNLSEKIGKNQPLRVDLSHLGFQVNTANDLVEFATKHVPKSNLKSCVEQMIQTWQTYEHGLKGPSKELFAKKASDQEIFYQSLLSAQHRLKDIKTLQTLQSAGFQHTQMHQVSQRLERLVKATENMSNLMHEMSKNFQDGKVEQGINLYKKSMPEYYAQFCDAMREWQQEQKHLNRMLREQNPLEIDLTHAGFQVETILDLSSYVQEEGLTIDMQEPFGKMIRSWENYQKEVKLGQEIEKQVNEAISQEEEFNAHLQQVIEKFENQDFIAQLKNQAWSVQGITQYQQKLSILKTHSDSFLGRLKITQYHLNSGQIQEGIDWLNETVGGSYKTYVQDAVDFEILQRVAQGRSLKPDPIFQLKHTIKNYPPLLNSMLKSITEANIIHMSGKQLFEVDRWKKTSDAAAIELKILTEMGEIPTLVKGLVIDHQRNREFTSRMSTFVKNYKEHRELFEEIMRQNGISDLESAFIFNHYVGVEGVLREWDQRFQRVVDLASQGQYPVALEEYGRIVNEIYPRFQEQIRNVFFSASRLQEASVKKALGMFATRVGISQINPSDLLNSQGEGPRRLMMLKECIENAKKIEIQIPSSLTSAVDTIDHVLKADILRMDEFSRLFKPIDLLNPPSLQGDSELLSAWQKFLKAKWKQERIDAFVKLSNHHNAIIRHLKEAERAIATETNPQKKRALQTQFRKLEEELLPQLNQVRKEWGSMKQKPLSFASLTQKFAASYSLDTLYNKRSTLNQKQGFTTSSHLLARLENYVKELPPNEQEGAYKVYADELVLIPKIRAVQRLNQESLDFETMTKDQDRYIDALYSRIGLYPSTQKGVVRRIFLEGPHKKDTQFLTQLRQKGWNLEKIEQLNSWYDRYQAAARPLQLAKIALEEDPENILLQKEYKRIAGLQINQLNKLAKEFKTAFKSTNQVRELEEALKTYYRTLLMKENQEASTIQQTTQTWERLQSVKIADKIKKTDFFLSEASRLYLMPMSEDPEYLDILLPDKTSPLMLLKPQGKAFWSACLTKHKMNRDDIKQILKLQKDYQKETAQMMELERKLDAEPGNSKLRNRLTQELAQRRGTLSSLKNRFQALQNKIQALQAAIQDYQEHFQKFERAEKKLEIYTKEPLINLPLPESKEGQEILNKQAAFQKKRLFGDLTDHQIHGLHRLSGELNILEAFQRRNAFIHDTYQRFGSPI